MRHRLLVATLALASSPLAFAGRAAAQGPTPEEATTRLRLGASVPVTQVRFTAARNLPDSVVPKRKDHTVTGLLIGAGLGFVAGWAFYNTLCEAVNNRCSDSRVALVVLGMAVGAGLGALVGSSAD